MLVVGGARYNTCSRGFLLESHGGEGVESGGRHNTRSSYDPQDCRHGMASEHTRGRVGTRAFG